MATPEQESFPPIRPRVRRLSLLDLIGIIAVFAVWSVLVRSYAEGMNLFPPWYRTIWRLPITDLVGIPLAYLLTLAAPTMVVLRLRQPRPPRRCLWRQPGMVASVAATVGLLMGLAHFGETTLAALNPLSGKLSFYFTRVTPYAAPSVVGAWLALRLTGRWRSERSGIDRLGRLVGWLWLVEFALVELPLTKWVSIIRNISDGSRP